MTKKTITYLFDLTDLILNLSVKYILIPPSAGGQQIRIYARKGINKWTLFYQDGKSPIQQLFKNGVHLKDAEVTALILFSVKNPGKIELMYK